jgi:hypothetical protein
MNALVDLHAGAIVGRDNQRALWRICILFRNRRNALVVIGNLMDAALPVKILDCLSHFAARKLLDGLFQLRVFLAHDLIEPDRLHACVLKLCKGPPGLHGLMLSPVAYQQHAVVRMKPVHKFMQLPGRCHRGFVEHIEPFFAVSGCWLRARYFWIVDVSIPASASFWAARDVGAKPSTSVSVGHAFANHGQRRRLARARDAIQWPTIFSREIRMSVHGLTL